MNAISRIATPLAAMLDAVDSGGAAAAGGPPRRPSRARWPCMPACRTCSPAATVPATPDRYARHLLGEGASHAVVALVWRPGQLSPIHAHKTWCALAVHRGTMTEHHFAPGEPPRPVAARLLPRAPRARAWPGRN
jgi:hypothetical protein